MRVMALVLMVLAVGCKKDEPDFIVPMPGEVRTNRAPKTVPPIYPDRAQPRLPTIKFFLGDVDLEVEQALTPVQIQMGMMFRKSMGEMEGMVFVHPDVKERHYWMKNVSVPLSIAYLDPEGRIMETHDMRPFDEGRVSSVSKNIQYALEVPQGWFRRNNVKPGTIVRTAKGTMRETYFPTSRK